MTAYLLRGANRAN